MKSYSEDMKKILWKKFEKELIQKQQLSTLKRRSAEHKAGLKKSCGIA